jgi:hypothetical protein
MDEGQKLSKRQLELKGSVKRLHNLLTLPSASISLSFMLQLSLL